MTEGLIAHLVDRPTWVAASGAGRYAPASLATEGFVHCSTPEQLAGTRARFFAGVPDLIVLWIPVERVAADLRWEGGFPHVYRALVPDDVVRVSEPPP